jgi:hypothetical protein
MNCKVTFLLLANVLEHWKREKKRARPSWFIPECYLLANQSINQSNLKIK